LRYTLGAIGAVAFGYESALVVSSTLPLDSSKRCHHEEGVESATDVGVTAAGGTRHAKLGAVLKIRLWVNHLAKPARDRAFRNLWHTLDRKIIVPRAQGAHRSCGSVLRGSV